ncbi:MAG: menaquinone biosynthesis protein [Vampirovibrionia bacterium]
MIITNHTEELTLTNKDNTNNKVLLGKYNFVNVLPINVPLDGLKLKNTISTYGTPNTINNLLNSGQLNAGPISLYEYLRYQEKYVLLNDISISSQKTVGSVILFSKTAIENLNNKKIGIAHTSSTSVKLLQLLIRVKCKTDSLYVVHKYEKDLTSLLNIYDAVLFIGDPALINNYNDNLDKNIIKYDLAEEWYKITGLPMTFGVWVASKNWSINNNKQLQSLNTDLINAKNEGLNNQYEKVLQIAKKETNLNEEILNIYFKQQLNYDLNDGNKKSITLFTSMLKDYKLI